MALIARGEKPSHQLKVHQKLIEGLRILSILADLIDSHLLSVSLSYEVIILDARPPDKGLEGGKSFQDWWVESGWLPIYQFPITRSQRQQAQTLKKIISIFGNAFLCCHNNLTCLINHKTICIWFYSKFQQQEWQYCDWWGGYFSKCSNAVIICEPPNKAGIRNDWQMSIKKVNFEKRRFRL